MRGQTETPDGRTGRWLAAGLLALAVGLAANSILGPLFAGVVTYPLSESVLNQTVGLEAVSLLIVAPWSAVAAVLVLREHRAGPILAIAPTAYAAYMFVQYVVGPVYTEYPPQLPLHLAIFVLSWLLLVLAWSRVRVEHLPTTSRRRERRFGVVLLLLAAFVVSRYVAAVQGVLTGARISQEFAADPAMYWTIVLLDLGVVVPATVAAGVGLLRGAAWARRALYGVVGWYALVPISVAAMSIAMVLDGDPYASAGAAAAFSVVGVLFAAFAVWVYRPLFRRPDAARQES